MIGNAIIGMTALATGMTGAAAVVQITAQASPIFSESLLAASKTLSNADTANEDTPKGTSHQRSTFDDARNPGSHLSGHATFPQRHYQLAGVPLQAIFPKSEPIVNPAPIAILVPFALSVSSPDLSAIVVDQPMQVVASERVARGKSDVGQTGMFQLGSYPAQASSIAPKVRNLAANAPSVDVAKPGNEVSNAVANAAPSPLRAPVQEIVTDATPDGLLASMFNVVSGAASNSTLIAGPVPSLRGTVNAIPDGVEWSGLTNPAQAAPVVPASKPGNEFSDALVKAVLNTLPSPNQDARTGASPDGSRYLTPSVVPSAVSNSGLNGDPVPSLRAAVAPVSDGTIRPVLTILDANAFGMPTVMPVYEATNAVVPAALNALQNPSQDAIMKSGPDGVPNSTPSVIPGAASNSTRSSDPAPTLRAAVNASPEGVEWSGLTNSTVTAPVVPASKLGDESSDALVKAVSNTSLSPYQDAKTNANPDRAQYSTPGVAPSAVSKSSLNADPVPSLRAAVTAIPGGTIRPTLTILNENAFVMPMVMPVYAASNAVVPAASNALQNPSRDAITKTAPDSMPNSTPSMVPGETSKSTPSAGTVPTLRASLTALPNRVVAAMPSASPTDNVLPSAKTPYENVFPGPGLIASGMTADQFGAFTQPGDGLPVTGLAGVSHLNSSSVMQQSPGSASTGKDESKTEIKAASGLNEHTQSASDLAGSKTGSQEAPIPGDQCQSGTSSQAQGAEQSQMNYADHSAGMIAHAHNSTNGSAVQTVPTNVVGTSLAAKIAGDPTPISTSLPQALPVINTARLIQALGQSEIRVGMRSSEFGNISISTSVTRDVISGQISVDHGELAKTIAAGLPEMQARLGGNQAVDFKIETNEAGIAHGAGTSSGMPSGSAEQSSGGRQQAGNSASGYSPNSVAERHSSIAAAATTTGDDRVNARLDIRV